MTAALLKEKLGNFFVTSPFQDIVDQATSEYLLTPDWDKNLIIVDQINLKLENAKEVLKALKKRTAHSKSQVQYLALNLLETCVKNCGTTFRRELCLHKELHTDILKIALKDARKSEEHQAKEKALEMINTWHHSFRSKNQFSALTSLYQQALGGGAHFGNIKVDEDVLLNDEHSPPPFNSMQTAKRREEHNMSRVHFAPSASEKRQIPFEATLNPNTDLQQIIDEAHGCVGFLDELLVANESEPTLLLTDDICQQVVLQNRRLQAQIVCAIEASAASEGMFEILLELNDSIVKNLEKFENLTAEAQVFKSSEPQPSATKATTPKPIVQEAPNPLDDLLGFSDVSSQPASHTLDAFFDSTTPQQQQLQTSQKNTLDELFDTPLSTEISKKTPPSDPVEEAFFSSRNVNSQCNNAKPVVCSNSDVSTSITPTLKEHDEFDEFVNRHNPPTNANDPTAFSQNTNVQKEVADDDFDSFLDSRLNA